MTLYVFLGPSLPLAEARALCPAAIYLPPVRLGDVHRCVAFGGATAIAIIDGYFERVPAVWHKEILWALTNGVAVAGASSMGALRAAELAPFGMIGVGCIFDAYRRGVFPGFEGEPFEDDDEVAVVHAPAEAGWVATEAMVTIRATLAAATAAGVIPQPLCRRLAALAKAMFYKERSWATLLRRAEAAGDNGETLARLRAWLPEGRIDQKRDDAAALLHRLRADPPPEPAVPFAFADTSLWRRAVAPAAEDADAGVLVELRLQGAEAWRQVRDDAWAALIGGSADDAGPPLPDPGQHADPAAALAALERLAQDETRRLERATAAAPLLDAAILSRLHRDGRYGELAGRTAAKRRLAAAPDGSREPPEADALLAWFAGRSGRLAPTDAGALAAELDFADAADLLRALADEWRLATTGGERRP